MQNYPHETEMRLREAEAALKRIEAAVSGEELKSALQTFLNATKHALFPIQNAVNDIPGGREWWVESVRPRLKDDRLARFFWQFRNDTTKGNDSILGRIEFFIEGPLKLGGPAFIGADGVYRGVNKEGAKHWEPVTDVPGMRINGWRLGKPLPDGYDRDKPVAACRECLQTLWNVSKEFIKKFC